MRARIRHNVTKKAIQKHTAIPAVMMKFRGDTSQDVSDTMRPKALALKSIASCRSHGNPRNATAIAWCVNPSTVAMSRTSRSCSGI